VDGSGKLYQLDSTNNIKRIDNTCFEGGTFGSHNFIYNDTIFSLGGYGFWNYNGTLRYYNENTKEWSVIETNLTFPIYTKINAKFWQDRINEKLYVVYSVPKNIYIKDSQKSKDSIFVQCLNLKTKDWWSSPKLLNTKIFTDILQLTQETSLETEIGPVLLKDEIFYLLNFNNNQILKFNKQQSRNLYDFMLNNNHLLFYSSNSSFKSFNQSEQKIDSFKYNITDFTKIDTPLYTEQYFKNEYIFNSFFVYTLIWTNILLFSLLIFIKIRYNSTISKLIKGTSKKEIVLSTDLPFKENLTQVENQLLDLLINNSLRLNMTNVIDINQTLGITKKPIKIQNNIRANTILTINKKFMKYREHSDNLIINQRSEFDKRYFEYYINEKFINDLR
jgi:hypothetical protein